MDLHTILSKGGYDRTKLTTICKAENFEIEPQVDRELGRIMVEAGRLSRDSVPRNRHE